MSHMTVKSFWLKLELGLGFKSVFCWGLGGGGGHLIRGLPGTDSHG